MMKRPLLLDTHLPDFVNSCLSSLSVNVVYVQCDAPYRSRLDLLNKRETSAFNLTKENQ